MRRYTITLGARTSAGGRVVSASGSGCINGVPIALEGDLVACPACKATGRILCVGPRIPEMSDGKHVALENDLCTCRCVPPPKLLTVQIMRSQVLKDTGRALSNSDSIASHAARAAANGPSFNERFVLLDEETGDPLVHKEYAVVRASGQLEFGTSDRNGYTHLLSTTAMPESVELFV
ncbi:PAAR domain-containing protein [Massilia atriviolacea]|uniref:PAAR domain-containing protein n=1 Tax=Massilia atriviolacea TaxID=2495579 RepID=UPI0018E09DAD|nr:PAAR domain-containing protein [Massilia atriviolacea]